MFYVYVYRDPRPSKDLQPVYVGKGCGARATAHWRNGNNVNPIFNAWLAAIRRAGLEPVIDIVAEFENEVDAFVKERELIALFGRKDRKTGPLCNCTDGGEGMAGYVFSDESRAKCAASAAVRDKTPYESEMFKQKVAEASKRNWQNPEYRQQTLENMRAAQRTETAVARRRENTKAGWTNEETRRKRVEGIKASRTPELRAQLSASCSALWDAETRAIQSAKMKQVLASPEMKAQRSAQLRAKPIKPPKAVVAVRPSGEREEFRSLLEARERTGVSYLVLRKLLAGGTLKKGAFVGWRFEYLDTPQNP